MPTVAIAPKKRKVRAIAYREIRSYYAAGFHIQDDVTEEVLCGYSRGVPTNTSQEVTVASVTASWPNQHSGWYWCVSCAKKLFEDSGVVFSLPERV